MTALTSGSDNSAIGAGALVNVTSGSQNIANGFQALFDDGTGSSNIASGRFALQFNSSGNNNIATGTNALKSNTTGQRERCHRHKRAPAQHDRHRQRRHRIALTRLRNGNIALTSCRTPPARQRGERNRCPVQEQDRPRQRRGGDVALFSNTAGPDNVATGTGALFANTGSHNVASGSDALENNTTGASDNTAIGFNALLNSTGAGNLALGSGAGKNLTTGSHNVDIANPGVAKESGTIRIGTAFQTAAYLAGVWNKTAPGPTKAVVINKNGRLATGPAPAAPVASQARTISRLRDRVGKLASEVQGLQREVRAGG